MSGPRRYNSPLRDEQARQTRTIILDALVDLISERGVEELSIPDLAARASVSQRTVYRHFPDRAALLDGLAELVGERAGWKRPSDVASSIFDVPDLVPEEFARYDEFERETRAVVLLNLDPARTASMTREHHAQIAEWLAESFPDLGTREVASATAVLHLLVSSRTWLRLRDGAGLSGPEAAEAVRWAMQALLDDLETHGRVGRPEP